MNAVAALPYAEFAVRSNFSFLHGASRPEELAVTAKLLGLMAFGLADTNSVAGVEHGWSFRTARPTFSPIRRTGAAGGICAAC